MSPLLLFPSPPQGTDNFESYSPNLTKLWTPPRTCAAPSHGYRGIFNGNRYDSNAITPEYNVLGFDVPPGAYDPTQDNEVDGRGVLSGAAARSKVSRRSESLGLSSCSRMSLSSGLVLLVFAMLVSRVSANLC